MKYTEEVDIENLIRLLYSGTLTQYGKRKLIDYLRKLEEQVEYDKTHIITPQTIELNYIPKKTIKDKIKELEKYIYTGENAPQDFLQYRVKAKIQGYKELLGDE